MEILGVTQTTDHTKRTYTSDIALMDKENNEIIHLIIEFRHPINDINSIISFKVEPPSDIRFTKNQVLLYLKKILEGNYIGSDPDPVTEIERENYNRIIEMILRKIKFNYKNNQSEYSVFISNEEDLYKEIKKILK